MPLQMSLFPNIPAPRSLQQTHSPQKSKCCSCGERTGSYFEAELERKPEKNGFGREMDQGWFLVGNPYKPSLVIVTGWGVDRNDFYGLESGMIPWWYLYKSKTWLKLLPFESKYLLYRRKMVTHPLRHCNMVRESIIPCSAVLVEVLHLVVTSQLAVTNPSSLNPGFQRTIWPEVGQTEWIILMG